MWQLTHQVMSELMNHLMNQFIRFNTMLEDHWRSNLVHCTCITNVSHLSSKDCDHAVAKQYQSCNDE